MQTVEAQTGRDLNTEIFDSRNLKSEEKSILKHAQKQLRQVIKGIIVIYHFLSVDLC